MRLKHLALTLILIVLGTLVTSPAHAQQRESGTITGTVTDKDGSPVPGVTVTASSTERGDTTAYTAEDGFYRFPVLLPGTYEIKAALEGFETAVRKDVRLFVGQTVNVNLSIGVTAMQEALVISGETPVIDASTTASSKTVPVETIEN